MKTVEHYLIYEDADIAQFFPKRDPDLHKGACGTAAILGGEASVGASLLAAGAWLKSGAGYTKLFLPASVYDAVFAPAVTRYPACILRAFSAVEGELLAADAIALGMGAGVSQGLYEAIAKLLEAFRGTLVLDADALNALAAYGKDILKTKRCAVIVTPHPKEFSRLTGKGVEEILANPAPLAEAFAAEYGATVILKGSRSVITDSVRTAINPTGSPALAKGGSGDALSGFLAGTAARGVPPFEAAVAASYLLGKAGEIAAKEMSEYAPDATDIIARFGKAILSL